MVKNPFPLGMLIAVIIILTLGYGAIKGCINIFFTSEAEKEYKEEAEKKYNEEMERTKREGAEWEIVGSNEDGVIYYKKTSIKRVIWHGHNSREFIWQIMPKELNPPIRYIALVDCENPRFITFPLSMYEENKKLLDYSAKGFPIYKNMGIASMHKDVCYKFP